MRLRKLAAGALLCAMTVTTMAGCGKKAPGNDVSEINVTYVKSPLNVPSILQKNDDLFGAEYKDDNIAVNFHEITSGPDQTAAMAAGELDFLHALGGTSALIAASSGVEFYILNTYSRSPKGFMIIAKDETIVSAKDLVGKTVAGPKGTILHQILIAALKEEGYTVADVNFVQMGIADAALALEDGSVDAALVAGPTALTAINAGSTVVTTGEGLVDGIIVTAVSKNFADQNPDLVERFLKVEEETLTYMEENYDETMEKVAQEVGLTVDQTKEMYSWYDFSLEITDADLLSLEETQEFLIENELQENRVNISDYLYER